MSSNKYIIVEKIDGCILRPIVYQGRRGDEEHTESDVGGISGEDRGHRTHQVGVGLARTAGDCWLPDLLVCARRDRHHHSHFTTVLPGNARPGLYYMLLTVRCHVHRLLIHLVTSFSFYNVKVNFSIPFLILYFLFVSSQY